MFSNYWGFCLKAGKSVGFFFSRFPHRPPAHGGRCGCRQQHLFVCNGQAKLAPQGNGVPGAQRSPTNEHTPWGQSHLGGRQWAGWKRFSGSFITFAFATITKITRNKHRRNLTSIIDWTATDLEKKENVTVVLVIRTERIRLAALTGKGHHAKRMHSRRPAIKTRFKNLFRRDTFRICDLTVH